MYHPDRHSFVEKLITEKRVSPSILRLQERIGDWFRDHQGRPAAFPNSGCDLSWPTGPEIPVVLFGSPIFFLGQLHYWPREPRYQLHFLSTPVRRLFSAITGVAVNQTAVIPRDQIFVPVEKHPFPDLRNDPLDIILIGRILKERNIDQSVQLVRRIASVNRDCRIFIAGTKVSPEEQTSFRHLADPVPVMFLGTDWKEFVFRSPVVLNLSTSLTEDFSLGTAEAQESGLPLILSHWGALQDVTGPHVRKIRSDQIDTFDPFQDAFLTAEKPNDEGTSPRSFTWVELDLLARVVREKLKEDTQPFHRLTPAVRELLVNSFRSSP